MAHSFSNKHIVIAVTGGIAAYKVAGWASSLVKCFIQMGHSDTLILSVSSTFPADILNY